MKKFKFSLDSVLSYKQQILDALRGEHAALLAEVREQEDLLERCWQNYRDYNEEFRERSRIGLPLTEALLYQTNLRGMEREIQQETAILEEKRKKEEEKREEVVEAKTETTSIEKLKEKKLRAYQKAEAKSEELFIEDVVNMTRILSREA